MTSKETVHIVAHKKVVEFMQEYFVSNPEAKTIHSSLIKKEMDWSQPQTWYALKCIEEMGSIHRIGCVQSPLWELTYKLRITKKAIRLRNEEKHLLKTMQNVSILNHITEYRVSLSTKIA